MQRCPHAQARWKLRRDATRRLRRSEERQQANGTVNHDALIAMTFRGLPDGSDCPRRAAVPDPSRQAQPYLVSQVPVFTRLIRRESPEAMSGVLSDHCAT